MHMCLDVGNTNIYAGVYKNHEIILRFRYDSTLNVTSDQLGIFLSLALKENNISLKEVKQISIASVVPNLDYPLRAACIKYFKQEPFFLTFAKIKTKIDISTPYPQRLGADIIAGALAAINLLPNQNIIVVDFGTATTIFAITNEKKIVGGVIVAGIKLAMQALSSGTAKLSTVEIVKPKHALGVTTEECIQSGLYYGNLGIINEFVTRFTHEVFHGKPPKIIATGGLSILFQDEKIFNLVAPDLVLDGIKLAAEKC